MYFDNARCGANEINSVSLWTMVIVARIVVAPCYGATRPVRGFRHGIEFRTGSAHRALSVPSAFGNRRDDTFTKKIWCAGLKAVLRANPG